MFDDTMSPDPSDVEKNKIMGIIAYLGCLCLVPILVAKDSQFARYHANQGLILLIGWVLLIALDFMVSMWIISMGIVVLWLGLIFLSILGIIKAAAGKMEPLPLIGGFTIIK